MYSLQLCQLTQQQISSQQWISKIECNAGNKGSIRSWFLYILHVKLLVSKIWSNAGNRFKHIIYTVYLWHFLPMLCLTFKDFFLILSVGVFTWEESYIYVFPVLILMSHLLMPWIIGRLQNFLVGKRNCSLKYKPSFQKQIKLTFLAINIKIIISGHKW